MSQPTNSIEKPIYFLDEEDVYHGNAPYFYNEADYDWVKTIEDNSHIIMEEFEDYINGSKELGSSSIYPPNLSSADAWQNVYFWNFKWKKHKNCRQFPRTYELLKSIPNMVFAEVTKLQPQSAVLPHIGETNVTIRGHLGLKIPAQLPDAGIKVGDIERSWEDGKVLLFSDAHRHTVWNKTDEARFVVVFDVLRDEYADQKNWACAQCLGALTLKYFDNFISFFKKLPKPILRVFHVSVSVLWLMYLPFQNRIRFLP